MTDHLSTAQDFATSYFATCGISHITTFSNWLLLHISLILLMLVFLVSKLFLTIFLLVSHTHILQLLFFIKIHPTTCPSLDKRSPHIHMHPAAPFNQYVLHSPHVNLDIQLWFWQHLPQAFAVPITWSLQSFSLFCLTSHFWLSQTKPFHLQNLQLFPTRFPHSNSSPFISTFTLIFSVRVQLKPFSALGMRLFSLFWIEIVYCRWGIT